MPRVSLLLADDVGLGKTIEAGLILNELLIRRRIRRVLIICPASLRFQWQQEMQEKFSWALMSLTGGNTRAAEAPGLDTNPWRAYPRVIASYHYLKQQDILSQFRATCQQTGTASAQLPWDLLIVDEAHNLTPSHFGDDSDLARMLRLISPQFEHRLFLSATPHNGYARSFTGLLQQLDPVRFHQSSEVDEDRVKEVVIRRLKREIREADAAAGRPERFARRELEPVALFFGPEEERLSKAFSDFRKRLLWLISGASRGDQTAAASPSKCSTSACCPVHTRSPTPGCVLKKVLAISPRLTRRKSDLPSNLLKRILPTIVNARSAPVTLCGQSEPGFGRGKKRLHLKLRKLIAPWRSSV